MTDHEIKLPSGEALAEIAHEAGLLVDALQIIEDQTGDIRRRIVELALRLREVRLNGVRAQ
jgi:hypothetical protein